MSDYTLTQAEYSRLKRRLTVAENKLKGARKSGGFADMVAAATKVIKEVDFANGVFAAKGHPDDWSRWMRAKEDAELVCRRPMSFFGGGGE